MFRLRERHEQNTGLQEAVAKNGKARTYSNEFEYLEELVMLEVLTIILIIIFSPVILIAGVFSLFIILGLIITVLGIIFTIICIPVGLVKALIDKIKNKDKKQVEVDG